jgi:hypothetical protein
LGSLTRTDAGSNSALTAPTLNSATKIFGGNVGIGTNNPKAVAHVGKLSANSGTFNDIPQSNMGISATFPDSTRLWLSNRLSATGEDYWGMALGTKYTGDIYIQSVNKGSTAIYDLLLQPNGGNVGIGTPSPGTKLHVQSVGTGTTVLITGPTQGNSGGPNNDPWTGLEFQRLGTNGETYNGSVNLRAYRWATSGQDPAMALRFNLSSTAPYNTADVMTLRSDGNVGIGTTSPSYNLDVNGSFGAKNKGWYITGGGGNAVYNGANSNKNYFAYNVNNTFYGSSVTTYNGASSSAWRSNDGVFTYPEAGLYQVTIHMFINATSSGRYGVFRLNDSGGSTQFSQYMYFTPSGYAAGYQRSWTTFVRVESGWQSYMQPEGGSITLYLSNQHTCLLIDKIC